MSVCRFFFRSMLKFSSLILVRSHLDFCIFFTRFSAHLKFLFNEALIQEVVLVCDILDSICCVLYKPVKTVSKFMGLCVYVLI